MPPRRWPGCDRPPSPRGTHTMPFAKPEEAGFVPGRLQRAFDLLDEWTRTDQMPSAAPCVGCQGLMLEPRFFGRVRSDALFLLASLTKPVTVAAAMLLVERGQVMLDDPVALYIPKFADNGKHDVQVRHLMTHTSGLPDMVPNNLL